MSNEHAWYYGALKNPSAVGSRELPLHDGDVHPGFYVRKEKRHPADSNKPDIPAEIVAFWRHNGEMVGAIGSGDRYRAIPEDRLHEYFMSCCRQPITFGLYSKIKDGGAMPPEYLAREKKAPEPKKEPSKAPEPTTLQHRKAPVRDGPEKIGHNQPPPGEEIAAKIAAENRLLKELTAKPVKDDETSDKITDAFNRLLKLKSEAAEQHKTMKAPILQRGREIDEMFFPSIRAAEDGVKLGKRAVADFLKEKQKKLDEEHAAKVKAAREEAERKAKEEAELNGEDPEQVEIPLDQVKEPKRETAKVGGGTGRAYTARAAAAAVRYTAEITDFDKALLFFKDEVQVRDVIERLAHKLVNTKDAELPAFIKAHKEG